MADDAMFPGPGGKKGPPNWLLIGGAGVGIIAVIVLITRNTGGSSTPGTTAAGSSINAALGSIQEEQQNLLGTVQASALANMTNFQGVNSNMTANQNQILSEFAAMQTSQSDILDAINSGNTTLLGAIQSIKPQLDQIFSLQQQMQTTSGAQYQALSSQISGLQSSVTSGLQAVTQGNDAQFASLTNYLSGQFNMQGSQLGTLLNWTDEIKGRLQNGDYSLAYHGPSYQPWTSAI